MAVRGFTLIEVMIAVVILSVGLTGLIALFGSGINAVTIAKRTTIDSHLASAKLEELRALPSTKLVGQDTPDASGRTWAVSCLPPCLGLRLITIKVRHAEIDTVVLKGFIYTP